MYKLNYRILLNTSYPILADCGYPAYPCSEGVACSANQVCLPRLHVPGHIAADMVNFQDTDLHMGYTRCWEEDSIPAVAEGTVDHTQPADMADTFVAVEVVVGLVISIRPIHQPKQPGLDFS